jgi:hypothetical protein
MLSTRSRAQIALGITSETQDGCLRPGRNNTERFQKNSNVAKHAWELSNKIDFKRGKNF